MKRRLAVPLLTAATLALALAAGPARAGSATANLTVTANVVGSCEIDAAELDFGLYDAATAAHTEAFADISVRCNYGTPYQIAIDGANGSRSMTNGSDSLDYELYSDSARTVAWDTTSPVNATASNTGVGLSPNSNIVYGRIPAGQVVSPGDYEDILVVTVTF